RKITLYDTAVRRGAWHWQTGRPIGRLRGRIFGLLSFDAITREIAHRARPFGVEIWTHDPFVDDEDMRQQDVKPVSFDELIEEADCVVIEAPLTSATHGLFDEGVLRRMKSNAILVNTARGPIVEDRALYRALQAGWIGAGALDDIEKEPSKQREWHPENPILR